MDPPDTRKLIPASFAVNSLLPGFPLQHCFQFQFDLLKVIAPAIMLEHFNFGVVFLRKVHAIFGSNLIHFHPQPGNLFRDRAIVHSGLGYHCLRQRSVQFTTLGRLGWTPIRHRPSR